MSGGGTTQSISRQEIDPDIKRAQFNLLGDATNFLNSTPFQPFPGQMVAGQQPLQAAAQQFLTQSLLGQPIGFAAPQQFGPFAPTDPFQFTGGPTNLWNPVGGQPGTGGGGEPGTGVGDGDDPDQRDLGGRTGSDGTLWDIADPGFTMRDPNAVTDQQFPFAITLADTGSGMVGSRGGTVAGTNGLFNLPMGPTGQGETQQAINTAQNLTGFRPRDVLAQQAGIGLAGGVPDVQGGRFSAQRLAELQDPFTSQVIDQSLSDLDRARQLAVNQGARSAGASTYGGDRNALVEAETNRAFADAAARQVASLRSAGFNTAADLAGGELGMGLQAALANQSAGLGLNQFNADAINRANQFNSGLGLQAGLANQAADLGGAGLNLNAAGALSGFGGDLFGRTLTTADVLSRMGAQNQGLAQSMINAEFDQFNQARNDPLRGFGLLQSILSGVPVGFNTTQITPTNRAAGFAGGALSGAGVGSAFGPWGAGLGALGGGLLGLF